MSQLRAGAARAVITPRLGCHIAGYYEDRIAQDLRDDLHAKALVLESGGDYVAVVVCDLIHLPRADAAEAKARAERATGIPQQNILIAATHTHFGPATEAGYGVPREDEYMAWLPDRIADSVELARKRLRPALVGHASGSCPGEVFNRRYWMTDGAVVTNPGRRPEVVTPAGPTDPEVGLLVILDQDRHPIALLANYALHYVGGTAETDNTISADYFGAFDRALQRLAGESFVGIMLNGCCGDVNNLDIFGPEREHPYPHYQVDRVANAVAGAAFQAWSSIHSYQPSLRLASAAETLALRRQEVTEEEIAEARRRLAGADSAQQARIATSADPRWLEATRILELASAPPERETLVQALRIGEVGLVGLPGEIFVEIGLAIKQRSPFARTLVGELANDNLGYVPSERAFDEGSYEVYTSPVPRGTGALLADTAVGLLERLAG